MNAAAVSSARAGSGSGLRITCRWSWIALALFLALLAPSCASSQRLWRSSPFDAEATSDRMNLWPLAYHSGRGTSVLWPLFDVDDQGFALRPIVAKDGPKWDLLYPWASFDARTGNGWAVPFYSFGGSSGIFPLAHIGEFSYVTLAWWSRGAGGNVEAGGLFPVARFGELSYVGPVWWRSGSGGLFPVARFGELSYVGPVWWKSGSGGLFPVARFGDFNYVGPAWWTSNGGGLFPLVQFGNLNYLGPLWWTLGSCGLFPLLQFDDLSYVGPIWWSSDSGGLFPLIRFGATSYVGPVWWRRDSKSFGVFPVVGIGDLRYIGPAWWKRERDGTTAAGLFPLVWSAHDGDRFDFVPFYSHRITPKSRTRNYLLGLGHSRASPEESESWVLPAYYRRSTPKREDAVLFPLFWKRRRGDDTDLYTLLGNRSVDPKRRSLNVYPLWWSRESEQSSWKMLLPLFYYGAEGDQRTLLTPLGGRGWSRSGATRYFNLLGPVYHRARSEDGSDERTAVLWPLFERHRAGDRTTTRAAPFYSSTSSPGGSRGWYALGLGHFERTPSGSAHRLWPLYATSEGDSEPGPLHELTLYRERRHAAGTERRLFPLFESATSPTGSHKSFLFGLWNFSRSGADRSWHLWPFASHSESEDDPTLVHWTTLAGDERWAHHERWHLGSSLLYASSADEADGFRTRKRRVLTLFTDERSESLGHFVPRNTRPVRENLVRSREQGFLFGVLSRERLEYRVWRPGAVSEEEGRVLTAFSSRFDGVRELPRDEQRAAQILAERGRAPEQANAESLRQALSDYVASATEIVERERVRLPLLYDYDRTGERVEWNGLFGLVSSRQEPGSSQFRFLSSSFEFDPESGREEWNGPLWLVRSKREPGHSRLSVLYYGYRSETKGDETRRDIFPFVTWDTAPKAVEVSFLWRLFHYRRAGERSGGHVLFIPWGDA